MMNFEPFKLKRAIQKQGFAFVFYRPGKNPFGEPEGSFAIGMLTGLFHTGSPTERYNSDSNVQTKTERTDGCLCLLDDLRMLRLKPGDFCVINGKKYTINNFENIHEENVVIDILFNREDDERELG